MRLDFLAGTYTFQTQRITLTALGRGSALLLMSIKLAANLKAKALP